ncbi:unnamed protein product [Caenorhabditis brenneri]
MLYIFLLLLAWLAPVQVQPSPNANQTLSNITAYYESLLIDPPTPSHFNQSEFPLAERIHTITFPNGTNISKLIVGKSVKVHGNVSANFKFQFQNEHVGVFVLGTNISTVTHLIFANTTEKVHWLTVDCGIIKKHTFGNRVGFGKGNQTAPNECGSEKLVLLAITSSATSGEIYVERRSWLEDYTSVLLTITLLLTGLGYYFLCKICEPGEERDEEKLEEIRSLVENDEFKPILRDVGTQTRRETDKKYFHIFLIVLLFLTGLGWLFDNQSHIKTDRNVTNFLADDFSVASWNSFKADVASLDVHVPPRSKIPLAKRIYTYKWPNGTKIDYLLVGKKIKVKENTTASVVFQLEGSQIGVFAFNETITSFNNRFFVNTTDQTLWLFVKCGIITDFAVSNKIPQEHIDLNKHFSIQCRGSQFTLIAIPKTDISGSIYFGPTSPSPYIAYLIIILAIWIAKMGLNSLPLSKEPVKGLSKVENSEQVIAIMDQSNEETDGTIHTIVRIADFGTQTDFEYVEDNWFWDWIPCWFKKQEKPLDATNQLESGVTDADSDQFHDAMSRFNDEAPDLSLN